MKKIFYGGLLIFLGFSSQLFATAQIPDRLIYEGITYYLHNNPLEVYFKKYPKKRPDADLSSTALWRGYIATFELINDQLFLKDIEIQVWSHQEGKEEWEPNVELKSVLKEVFPNEDAIKIDWCTEVLILPYGKLKNYVHGGYASTYEHYVLLEMKEGQLTNKKQFDYKSLELFKAKQLILFKQSEAYQQLAQQWKRKYEYTEEETDVILQRDIFNYVHQFLDD